jgi:hypothetical protein
MFNAKIVKTYPAKGKLQLCRLESATSFLCSSCDERKTAKLVATDSHDTTRLVCNGCYGRLLSDPDAAGRSRAERDKETAAPEPVAQSASASQESRTDPQKGLTGAEDSPRFVVEEPDGGSPYDVVRTSTAIEWKLSVRAEHIAGKTLPIPEEMAGRLPRQTLHASFYRRGGSSLFSGPSDTAPELQGGLPQLARFHWPPLVPGTNVSVRWNLWTSIRFLLTPLRKPRVVDGCLVRFEYDPRVMTRDMVAATDVRVDHVEEAVLRTLRELGYLDADGRALLPDEALVRNTAERSRPYPPSRDKIRAAVQRLLSEGRLTRETGSLGPAGFLRYPARDGESLVPLVCYVPLVHLAGPEDVEKAALRAARDVSGHRVAGHLMEIGHLGKEASAAARDAYRRDHAAAGLVGPHELPPGSTYVREHQRGV